MRPVFEEQIVFVSAEYKFFSLKVVYKFHLLLLLLLLLLQMIIVRGKNVRVQISGRSSNEKRQCVEF